MDLNYTIKRSGRRRNLTITVERDRSIVVYAPLKTPERKIAELIDAKRQWIYEKLNHPQKYHGLPHPPGKELVNGESLFYLGRQYRIELIKQDLNGVKFNRHFYIPAEPPSQRAAALRKWYIGKAEEKIIPRVKKRAREIGVNVARIKIVDYRYRWGSCTPKNNINLNWRLIKAPMFVIDYVITHELAHLIEANHTPRFWNIIRAQIASMEVAKAWLKEHGQLLEGWI